VDTKFGDRHSFGHQDCGKKYLIRFGVKLYEVGEFRSHDFTVPLWIS